MNDDLEPRLIEWLLTQIPGASDVGIEGLNRATLGHSAETLLMTVVWNDGAEHRQDVVVRLRPEYPGLLEPYDLARQVQILNGLEGTPVKAPLALWHEPTGEVLGREFYVMERIDGTVYEQSTPAGASEAQVRRMFESLADELAAIHNVDLETTGLHAVADGRGYAARELDFWASEVERVKRAPLPALELIIAALRARQPEPCPRITLVHGDAKPGNYGFVGDDVNVVYDWELATTGDPLADIGWMEVMLTTYAVVGLPTMPGAFTADEFVARWSAATGIEAVHRDWYRGLQAVKMMAIQLVGVELFNSGLSDDVRFAYGGYGIELLCAPTLELLGLDPATELGPTLATDERMAAVQAR